MVLPDHTQLTKAHLLLKMAPCPHCSRPVHALIATTLFNDMWSAESTDKLFPNMDNKEHFLFPLRGVIRALPEEMAIGLGVCIVTVILSTFAWDYSLRLFS